LITNLRALFKVIFFATFLCFVNLNLSLAQNASNKGTDFWLAYGNHVAGYATPIGQEMVVYITSDISTSGNLNVGGVDIPFSVTANNITNVKVPQTAYLGNQEGKVSDKGIHITSIKPVVVYSHIYDSSISGATLVLPTNTLGKEYYSINYEQISNDNNSFSFFFVVAVEDNTQIVITPSVNTLGGLQAGVASKPISLNKGEIYQVFGTKTTTSNPFRGTDLTGSTIKSVSTGNNTCKKIAVFSGSGKISIGCLQPNNGTAGSADNLFQQVYPTATWGNSFITVPSKNRNYDIYRVFKSDPTATVKLNGAVIPSSSFTNNLYYDFPSQGVNYVESDKTIQVIQYAVTQGKSINCVNVNGDVGDPEMIFLNPLEQTLTKITMYSTPLNLILRHYINVVIPTSGVSSFKLDGVAQNAGFKPVAGLPNYSYAQLDVGPGTHNLQADIGFNAIAYGFGNAESYGYAAGASLVSVGLQARSSVSKQLKTVGCLNESYNFELTLPYAPTKLTLDLDNGSPAAEVPIKLVKTEVINGITNYTYEIINSVSFTAAKRYSTKVIVEKSTTDGCGSADEINLEFDIQNVPQSSFTSDKTTSCVSSPITFTDSSSPNSTTITKWHWDFGDGTKVTQTAAGPIQHSYSVAGDFMVTLIAESDGGCLSSPVSPLAVHINKTPDALFSIPTLNCEDQPIQFTDKSVANEGIVAEWIWDFGDGNSSSLQNPAHTYATPGKYTVKLIIKTDKGCISSVFNADVIVNVLPKVDFGVPDFCLADGSAQFTNNSTISDGTTSQLSYLWDFGDSLADAQRPNTSTSKNASHRYSKPGRYTVKLTVKSPNGCEETLSKIFVVNGSVPKADFVVKNSTGLCSYGLVEFEDKVIVELDEEVTKIEWIYDLINNPNVKMIDDEPALRAAPTRVYSHKYPTFTSPASITYQVRMLAYTGGTCVNVITKSVTVLAVPEVQFNVMADICSNSGPIQLTQGKEIHGVLAGTSTYTGRGVSASGMFNQANAGIGTHTLTYTFVTDNGCIDSKTQTITVNPAPTVDHGPDLLLLEGRTVKLQATLSGNIVSYKWSPSTYLDRDDILLPEATATEDITYTLTVTTDKGCTESSEVFIKVLKMPQVPNTFTPNGDGVNDTWNVKYLGDYPGATVDIFNRFGLKLYQIVNYVRPWDGTRNGTELPVGTYYYIINPRNERKPIYGSVTIIR
jgi:gliding motility-associated-like protein